MPRKLITSLSDEYKILQDKIDKIGAFRFTIKGWSVTVIAVSVAAGSAFGNIPIGCGSVDCFYF